LLMEIIPADEEVPKTDARADSVPVGGTMVKVDESEVVSPTAGTVEGMAKAQVQENKSRDTM
jgi:hypothetical protein